MPDKQKDPVISLRPGAEAEHSKKCKWCRHDIPQLATKCPQCREYQGQFRRLLYLCPIPLALLISALAFAIPEWRQSLAPDSQVVAHFVQAVASAPRSDEAKSDEFCLYANVVLSNEGERPATVEFMGFVDAVGQLRHPEDPVDLRTGTVISPEIGVSLGPGATLHAQFHIGEASQSRERFLQPPSGGTVATVGFVVRNHLGNLETITLPIDRRPVLSVSGNREARGEKVRADIRPVGLARSCHSFHSLEAKLARPDEVHLETAKLRALVVLKALDGRLDHRLTKQPFGSSRSSPRLSGHRCHPMHRPDANVVPPAGLPASSEST